MNFNTNRSSSLIMVAGLFSKATAERPIRLCFATVYFVSDSFPDAVQEVYS